MVAVEARPDLIETAKKIAAESGFDRMDFVEGKIAEAELGAVDIVTALHACDTATDEAILFALKHEAKFVALVPCCQAEVARELETRKARWTSSGATASSAANSARISPMCCAACSWKRMATRCG